MRAIGRSMASRRLTVAEVRALNDAPLELTGRPDPGVALIPASVIVRRIGAGVTPGLLFGSNVPAQYLTGFSTGDFDDDAAENPIGVNIGYGLAKIGRAEDAGDVRFAAIVGAPLSVAMEPTGDLSAADYELDIDVEILEVPVE